MKTKLSKITASKILCVGMIAGACLAFSGGCNTPLGQKVVGMLYSPTVTNTPPAVTNAVPVYAPIDIVKPANTNEQTGIISPPIVSSNAVASATNYVVVQPAPVVHYENGAVWGTAETAAGAIPGYGWLVTWALTLAAAGGKAYMNRREGNTLKTIAVTTFQGVENFINAAVASGDPKAAALANQLKSILASAHDYADVAPQVATLIDQYTGSSSDAQKIAAIAQAPVIVPGVAK